MGWLNFLTGTKRPASGTPRLPAEELPTRLLALNSPDLPWRIVDGADQQVDLICEWKVGESRWKETLEKLGKAEWKEDAEKLNLKVNQDDGPMMSGLGATTRHLLKFDNTRGKVRNIDRNFTVVSGREGWQWQLTVTYFRGQVRSKSFDSGSSGEKESFGTEDFKVPIRKAITESGWIYKAIMFGRL